MKLKWTVRQLFDVILSFDIHLIPTHFHQAMVWIAGETWTIPLFSANSIGCTTFRRAYGQAYNSTVKTGTGGIHGKSGILKRIREF